MSKILIVDDDKVLRNTLKYYLREYDFTILQATDAADGIGILEKEEPDLILCDLRMPGKSGLEFLEEMKRNDNKIPVILMTAFDDVNSTIKAMQLGAYDYLYKPLDITHLKLKIDQALQLKSLSEQLSDSLSEAKEHENIEKSLVGRNSAMRKIYKHIGQLSVNNVSVLIQGESGTGKERIAKVIHYSGKNNEPFIAVNCTAITESLLESELFGHVKGSFTGAFRDKKGKFELAGNGTIFLDEISEMSLGLQTKLLRVLQEKEFEKVGGEEVLKMNARIIAATNKDLEAMVEAGNFREDLYYRLKVFTINVPPLRERKDDIPLLAMHFLEQINIDLHKNVTKIPFEVMEKLQNYDWPGNVRQIQNTLKQAVVLSNSDVLESENILLPSLNSNSNGGSPLRSLEEVEKEHIIKVLKHFKGNKKETCKVLAISKPTLYSKINKYKINF